MAPAAEPEDAMVAVGNELLKPPAEEDPLLELLGRAEQLLSKVEQSPQPTMMKALDPVMKALVANELLKHPNVDVKVAVASCISEITRITAPEAPYDDDLMKAIFELIVEAFGGLNESPQLSQTSYRRRLSILETVAKVRSCVVMLDLECDGLILEMFRHFFRARRESHPENAYSLIETIMTVVLEESEDFSSELISCLLDSVKKDNKDAARELGESVIAKCGSKLKPYLLKELQSLDAPLSDYSRIVATVCHKTSDAPESNALSAPVTEDDSKLSERTVSEELQQGSTKINADGDVLEDAGTVGDKSPQRVPSNGVSPIAQQPASPSVHSEQAPHGDSKETEASAVAKSGELDSLGGKVHKIARQSAKKSKNRKGSSVVKTTLVTDNSPMDIDKDSTQHDDQQNEVGSDKIIKADAPLDDDKLAEMQLSEDGNDQVGLNSDPSRSKRGRPRGTKLPAKKGKGGLQVSPSSSRKVSVKDEDEMQLAKDSEKNVEVADKPPSGGKSLKSSNNKESTVEEPEKPSSNAPLKKQEEEIDDFKVKPAKKSGKKSEKIIDDQPSKTAQIRKEEKEETHDSEVKPAKKSGKKSEKIIDTESPKEPQIRKGRARKAGVNIEKDATEKEKPLEAASPPANVVKTNVEKHEAVSDDVVAKKPRKKQAHEEKEERKELDEGLIGSSICVWWPDDKKFYPGVISAFDSSTKKHTVTYEDGDVEVLLLKNERWKFVKSKGSKDETDGKSGDAAVEESFETPPKKKAKLISDSASKKAKLISDSASKKAKADSSLKRANVKGEGKPGSDHKQEADIGPEPSTKSKQKSGGLSSKHAPGDSGKKNKEKPSNKLKTETVEPAEAGSSKKEKTPKQKSETKEETATKSSRKNKEARQETDGSSMDVASLSSKSEKKNVAETLPDLEGSKSGRKNKGGSNPKSGSRSAANGGSSTKEVSSPKAQGTEDFSPKAHDGSRKRGRTSKS